MILVSHLRSWPLRRRVWRRQIQLTLLTNNSIRICIHWWFCNVHITPSDGNMTCDVNWPKILCSVCRSSDENTFLSSQTDKIRVAVRLIAASSLGATCYNKWCSRDISMYTYRSRLLKTSTIISVNSRRYSGPFRLLFCTTSLARYNSVTLRSLVAAIHSLTSLLHAYYNYLC